MAFPFFECLPTHTSSERRGNRQVGVTGHALLSTAGLSLAEHGRDGRRPRSCADRGAPLERALLLDRSHGWARDTRRALRRTRGPRSHTAATARLPRGVAAVAEVQGRR